MIFTHMLILHSAFFIANWQVLFNKTKGWPEYNWYFNSVFWIHDVMLLLNVYMNKCLSLPSKQRK